MIAHDQQLEILKRALRTCPHRERPCELPCRSCRQKFQQLQTLAHRMA